MASCAICKKSILFGGEKIAGVRYRSKNCSERGSALALTPDTAEERTKPKPAGPAWVFIWALTAIIFAIINFGVDIGSWPKGAVPQSAFSVAIGYALGPFILAGICMLWKQYRNLHSFFKVAGIIGAFLMFSALGRISEPRDVSIMVATSNALAWA